MNPYQIKIQLSGATVQALQENGFSLVVFQPLQATPSGGLPVVWLQTKSLTTVLAKISIVSHELKGVVAEADQSTTAVAARLKDAGQGKANDGKGKAGSSKGQPANSSSNGQGQPKH